MSGDNTYPVRLEADLEPDLSRWLWLVKWILLIPHFIVLVFLFVGLAFTTLISWFAILLTARYPRPLFDYAVGVMRWGWRVTYYSYSALGTDRYPPFTLADVDYPARLDVEYQERLSRGLALVKWWLLAIPHYIIVGLMTSGAAYVVTNPDGSETYEAGFSLLGFLVLVAGVSLLFRNRYPGGLFDFIMGINRWGARVWTYVFLLHDEYPPFRLEMGGAEPETTAV